MIMVISSGFQFPRQVGGCSHRLSEDCWRPSLPRSSSKCWRFLAFRKEPRFWKCSDCLQQEVSKGIRIWVRGTWNHCSWSPTKPQKETEMGVLCHANADHWLLENGAHPISALVQSEPWVDSSWSGCEQTFESWCLLVCSFTWNTICYLP